MTNMEMNELKEIRKQQFAQLEQQLLAGRKSEEDSLFYHHSSEDRILLSHALFWVMTQPQFLKGKIRKEKYFLLLRQYQEEMLDAYLTEDDYFSDLLHYCNIQYEMLPMLLNATHNLRIEKEARKLAAIAVVAVGYAGDMPEDLCNELLDSLDFEYNKVRSRMIEQMMPKLMKFVESEMEEM